MHLIDSQQSQLQDSVDEVERLRAHRGDSVVGKIKTFSSNSLEDALKSTWLVVEVRFARPARRMPANKLSSAFRNALR